jgi:hypothetical protein
MPALSGVRRVLPLLVAIAFAATACPMNLGPPGVDCGGSSQAECVRWAKLAQQVAEARGKTIWSIHVRQSGYDVRFTDGTGMTAFFDRAAPPPVPVSSQ